MTVQFAYLQIYSRFSPFGGVGAVERLADELLETGQSGPIAAALTDTFSLAGWSLWQQSLAGSAVAPIAGAEVGISLGQSGRNLPYSLILLAENATGYLNLSRLVSLSLLKAGATPLTASLDLEILKAHRQGLIAVAPYWGGPVVSGLLTNKGVEARARAEALRDVFGPQNFFLGVSPQLPTGNEQAEDKRVKEQVRLNAALVKLGRELKIGLVGTGETRYLRAEDARAYASLRGRLQRALSVQYPLSTVQHPSFSQDWLYAFGQARPLTDLELHDPARLIALYNERDWPGALVNNRLIAARCTGWFKPTDWQGRLRERCEQLLAKRPDASTVQGWLEKELAEISELGLAESLLGAARLTALGEETGLITVARRLNGSLVATLLGLSESPARPDFAFEAYTEGRPIRLEVGQGGRARLLESLNQGTEPTQWQAAGLAIATDPGEPAVLHPRRLLVALTQEGLQTVLQPAQTEHGLEVGVQTGPLAPDNCALLEIGESRGVSRLQVTLDILNDWRNRSLGQPNLKFSQISQPDLPPDVSERDLLMARLEWLRRHEPAAHYAAQLELADDPSRRAKVAETSRLEGISILKPDVHVGAVGFRLELQPPLIRAGLGQLVGEITARQIVVARPFENLDGLLEKVPLQADQIERLAWAGALDGLGERERLAANAPSLAMTARAWQEWRQSQNDKLVTPAAPDHATSGSEQLSLFDLFSQTEPMQETDRPLLEPPSPVELGDAPPLSALQRLRRAYDTLGFFTNEHPLWDQVGPTNSDAATDLPIALADLAGQEDNRPWLINGLVTGIRRLPLKISPEQGQGEELTVLQIEDFSGQAQLLVPRDTPATDVQLAEGVALAARVHRLKKDNNTILVAVALATYPALPGTPTATVADDAVPPPDQDGVALPVSDENWSESLFASLEPPVPPPPSAPPPQTRGKNSKPPPRLRRTITINLPRTDSPQTDLDMMNRLKQLLRKHAGDDKLVLFIPLPDGKVQRLEPQGLEVTYSEAFAADITGLVGLNGLKVEEYT